MSNRIAFLFRPAALIAVMMLAACGPASDEAELANLDNQIVGGDADPALTSALEDQILVDPTLSQQSNRNSVRPPESPVQAPYPQPASAPTGAASTPGPSAGACAGPFGYNPGWAKRLPAALAVYPGARVTEAAGNKGGVCRVATFVTDAAPRKVLDWYHARAVRAGYSSEQQVRDGDLILAGVDKSGGNAFYLIVTPKGRGTDVAVIASNGG